MKLLTEKKKNNHKNHGKRIKRHNVGLNQTPSSKL